MKLWEVIKEIENGSTKTYEATTAHGKIKIHKTEKGYLWLPRYLRLDYDWQPIPQTVTWQEALQAWADGENVVLNCGETENYLLGSHNYLQVSKEQIANGIWYVED